LRIFALFNRTNIIYIPTAMSQRLNILCYILYYSFLYKDTVRVVICECWHFTHMWKAFAWLHHFTKRGGFSPQKKLNPATFHWSACTKPESQRSCFCVLDVSILPLSTIWIFDFVFYFISSIISAISWPFDL
jgi:hypothetical protein